jgi:hypothetical protein
MVSRRIRNRSGVASLLFVLAILALAIPPLVAAANVTVNTIPGGGWIQGPDNNAADAVIAVSPTAGLGADSVALTIAASSNFVGIGRPIAQPLSDIGGGSWMTLVAGDTGDLSSEPAALKFGMNRLGASQFTTLIVERFRNGTVTAGTWQTTDLTDSSIVWQTNQTGSFCIQATPCTFAAFKTQYPNALVIGLQVAVGTGTGATTSYVDGVSLTIDDATTTWDFELAAAPSPSPSASASAAPSASASAAPSASASAAPSTPPSAAPTPTPTNPPGPATDVATPPSDSSTMFGPVLAIFAIIGLVALLSVRLRRPRSTD